MLTQMSPEVDIVACRMESFDDVPPLFKPDPPSGRSMKATDALLEVVAVHPQWEAHSKLFNRTLFDGGLGFREGTLYEDLEFTPRAFLAARRVVLLNNAWYGYRVRSGSIMQESAKAMSPDLITVLESSVEFVRRHLLASHPITDRMTTAFVLHASKTVERMGIRARVNSRDFLARYRAFIRRELPHVARTGLVSTPYLIGLRLSTWSPGGFATAFSGGRWLKANVTPGLRRARRINRHSD